MKRLALWSILALSLAANLTVAVRALRAQASSPMGIPLFAKVQPDPQQRARIMALRGDFLDFRKANFERGDVLRGQLAELLEVDEPDRAKIDAILAQLSENHAALQRRVVEQAISVRAVLRPDQRPAFEELMSRQLRSAVPLQRNGGQDERPSRSAP